MDPVMDVANETGTVEDVGRNTNGFGLQVILYR
jgi:hypothetical protein